MSDMTNKADIELQVLLKQLSDMQDGAINTAAYTDDDCVQEVLTAHTAGAHVSLILTATMQ